jgi:hypothetical protein
MTLKIEDGTTATVNQLLNDAVDANGRKIDWHKNGNEVIGETPMNDGTNRVWVHSFPVPDPTTVVRKTVEQR